MEQKLPQPLPHILTNNEIISTISRHIRAHSELVDNITKKFNGDTACFENVIRPLVELENTQAGEKAVINALKYCSRIIECQHAVEKAQALWEEYTSSPRRDLYDLTKAVKARGENLDYESHKLLDRMLLEFEEHGFGFLDDDSIQRRQKRITRIEELCAKFHRNLREHSGGELFTPEELDGVPAKDLQPINPDGKVFCSYSSMYFPIMRYAHNQETRKRFFLGHSQRFSENAPLFREVILLRDENARELGLASHAAAKLPYRSAESIEWVKDLMNRLTESLLPYGTIEFERVKEVKRRYQQDARAEHGGGNSELLLWDYLYYSTMPNGGISIDHASLAEYFPLRHTVDTMLDIFADSIQLKFHALPRKILNWSAWHDDVEVWSVWDERSGYKVDFIGYLFMDLLSRPNKFKGNQSVNLQPGYLKSDGTRVYPANTLMCNFSSSSPTTGCLLRHDSVVTLFHELGHCIHDLVARTKYARFHGFQVTLELGEGVGMMLEQWCWLPEELKTMGRHYTRVNPKYMEAWLKSNPGCGASPERIPDELIVKLQDRHGSGKVFKLLGMLTHVMFDLAVHNPSSREALCELDEAELFKDIYEKYKFRRLPNLSYNHVASGPLLAGYDAGYYSYICAEIFAADLFKTNFAENPRSRTAWQRFRQEILEHGGSKNELEMVEKFLGGRPLDLNALLSALNISSSL